MNIHCRIVISGLAVALATAGARLRGDVPFSARPDSLAPGATAPVAAAESLLPPPPAASPVPGPAVPPFSRYEIILERLPFGQPPPAPPPPPAAPDPALRQQAAEEQKLAKQIAMVAVNITPLGRVAVGFIDKSEKPPRNYYLNVGDSANGYTVTSADYNEETATLTKEGVTITLKLGQGLVPAVPVAAPAAPAAVASAPVPPASSSRRPAVLRRRLPLTPPGEADAAPSEPSAGEASGRRSLLPESPAASRGVDRSVPDQPVPRSMRAIDRMLESGEITEPSYVERLKQRREALQRRLAAQQEINELRQRERAQELGREELDRLVRERNLELIREGQTPVSPITLTPEEDAELVNAGVLPEK